MKNKAAQQLGSIKTEKKAKSSRENGKLGGRPNMNNKIQKVIKELEDRQKNPVKDVHTQYGSGYVDGLETAINFLLHEFEIEAKNAE